MKTQEAIKILEGLAVPIHAEAAFDMAISALQAQEAKNSNESSSTHKALDTISRTAAIDALKGLPTWWADEGGYYGGAQQPMVALLDPEDAVSAIENLPSAQPEIVRCKDCKYRGGLIGCYCDIVEKMVGVDSFCSWAERRTE